jgi:type I restriction enzyme M protein
LSEVLSGIVHYEQRDKERVSIYDFACGTGTLLAMTAKTFKGKPVYLQGHEANFQIAALCEMVIELSNLENTNCNFYTLNSLDSSRSRFFLDDRDKFDIAVSHFPVGYQGFYHYGFKYEPWFEHYKAPSRSDSDFAFVLHGLYYLKEGGVWAGVVHPGTLFVEGTNKTNRAKLVEEGKVHAVIRLPSSLHYGTGIPSSILVLKNGNFDEGVLFIDAFNCFSEGRPNRILDKSSVSKILKTYENREEQEGFSKIFSRQEIRDLDYNLNFKL